MGAEHERSVTVGCVATLAMKRWREQREPQVHLAACAVCFVNVRWPTIDQERASGTSRLAHR